MAGRLSKKITNCMFFIEDIEFLKPYFDLNSLPSFAEFYKKLNPCIEKEVEFSFEPDFGSIGLMVRGKNEQLFPKIIEFLKNSGLEEEKINLFGKINKLFPGTGLLFKTDFSKAGLKYSFYYQSLTSLPSLKNFIQKTTGFTSLSFEPLKKIMSVLGEKGFYPGMEFIKKEKSCMNYIFQNLRPESIKEKADKVMNLLSLKKENSIIFKKHFRILSENEPLYISLSSGKKLLRGLKIDFESPSEESIIKILEGENIELEKINKLKKIFSGFKVNNATYLGIKYSNKAVKFKLYFNRRYEEKNLAPIDAFAESLKKTIWLP